MTDNFIYKYVNEQEYDISNVVENVEMVIYSSLAFLLPFLMGHPQIVVGIGVNAALVLAALNLRGVKLLPVIIFPSLGVLARGLIFGPMTIYLVYMIPFIWVGNAILVYFVKRFMNSRIKASIYGSIVKSLFLFAIAAPLVLLNVLPKPFLIAMGPLQAFTAITGCVVGFGVHQAKKYAK